MLSSLINLCPSLRRIRQKGTKMESGYETLPDRQDSWEKRSFMNLLIGPKKCKFNFKIVKTGHNIFTISNSPFSNLVLPPGMGSKSPGPKTSPPHCVRYGARSETCLALPTTPTRDYEGTSQSAR